MSIENHQNLKTENGPVYSKNFPYYSKILTKKLLSHPDSSKKTYHLSLSIDDTLHFEPGDSCAIYPTNSESDIALLLNLLKVSDPEDTEIELLRSKKNISMFTTRVFYFLYDHLGEDDRALLEEQKQDPSFFDTLKTHDLISFLSIYHLERSPSLTEFLNVLGPIVPRFYSIASSKIKKPHEMDLLVGTFSYDVHGRKVTGLGSSYLCERCQVEETPIALFIHKTKHFRLPTDPNTPIIMIGPGTGLAPFKGFLEERAHQGSHKNWLFFGERNQGYDFYYKEFLTELVDSNHLKLSLAFSRDQAHKIYVQDRLLEEKEAVYSWIQNGAIIYVCGDAKSMAKDVQAALATILLHGGKLSLEGAEEELKKLRKSGQLILEVY